APCMTLTMCSAVDSASTRPCQLYTLLLHRRPLPPSPFVLSAAIALHQHRRAVRRNTESIPTIHARISQNLRKLPFLQDLSVQIDLVNIVEIVIENRFSIARPRWLAKRFAL